MRTYTVTLTPEWGEARTLWGIPAVFVPGIPQTLPLSPDQVRDLKAAGGFTVVPADAQGDTDTHTAKPPKGGRKD